MPKKKLMHQACLWQASLCALMRNHLTGGMKGGHSHQAVTIRKVVDITQRMTFLHSMCPSHNLWTRFLVAGTLAVCSYFYTSMYG